MSDSFDELSARCRRGELSRAEQQRLEVFLKASAEARLWHQAGRELDGEGAVLPGDHAAVERVMQRALSAFPAAAVTTVRRRSRFGLLLAAGALFVVSAAAASVEGVRYWHQHTQLVQLDANSPKPLRQAQRKPSLPVAAPAPATARAPATAPLDAPGPAPVNGASAAPSAVEPTRPKPASASGAAELFGAAALARREGNPTKAIALLDSLQERFPASPEARLSNMTLGALHLQRGAPVAALEHFRRYLRASPQGELASEAVWGEFQALSALGQRTDAERRLQLLIARYPGSAYAAAARAKLKAESAGP
jgi:TolA-binding protein